MNKYSFQRKVKLAEDKASVIRKHILEMAILAGGGHIAPALSIADILTCLYFCVMRFDSKKPIWQERDRFFLSKGHACLALYAVLSEAGFIKKDELKSFSQCDSRLFGHPEKNEKIGIEISTGSLGHALSIACGVAYAAKIDKKKFRCFLVMGDGECDEGSVWESIMFASHWKLDNIIVVVDRNSQQGMGDKTKILDSGDFLSKWKAFGWAAKECNGNDVPCMLRNLSTLPFKKGSPSVLIANTIKGKGISFMENCPKWHFRGLNKEEAELAKKELGITR